MKEAELLNHLMRKIADISARSDIESYSTWQIIAGVRWYDTSGLRQEEKPYVQDAVHYLILRGLLEKHPSNSALVRFKRRHPLKKAS